MGLVITILPLSLVVIVAVWILLEKRQPSSTMAWLLALLALPYLGLVLYLLFGRRRVERKRRRWRALREDLDEIPEDASLAVDNREDLAVLMSEAHQEVLFRFAMSDPELRPVVGNEVEILKNAGETYDSLFSAIEAASSYVLVEYYIVQPDEVGRRLREALIAKAREGVAVHFLYDGVGSWRLSQDWIKPMKDVGVACAAFLPLRLSLQRLRFRLNLRNHRKLVVVDGLVGYTGGLNIGEEYEGRGSRPFWRDTHLVVRGPAVRGLERIFHEDWAFASGVPMTIEGHFPPPEMVGDDVVQVLPSGPDRPWKRIHMQIFLAIANARERCYITTPYFVPDQSIRTSMVSAALRGVDIRLLVPRRSDMKVVLWAGRSYYDELLRAGVRIYEYTKGILHAKALVVDGTAGTLGSANMDIRSFLLNFEVNAFVFSASFASQLEEVFFEDLKDAEEIDGRSYPKRNKLRRLGEASARLLSPLL